MTHTLIVWCVLFCMHSVNLQPNASSVDTANPFEQFSGLELDAKRDLRVGFGDYAIATNAVTDISMGPRAHGGVRHSVGRDGVVAEVDTEIAFCV